MTLGTISSSILRIVDRAGLLYVFSSSGCDIYRISTREHVGQIPLPNTTCGCVNDDGVFLGTSGSGVFYTQHGTLGVISARQLYATTADLAILDDAIACLDGCGTNVIMAHGAGVCVVSDISEVYSAIIDGGATMCAIGDTQVSYTDGTNIYSEDIPTGDWTIPSGTEAVINSLQYVGDTLIAGTDSGMDVGALTIGSGDAWGMLNGDYLIWATSTGRTITRVSDATAVATSSTASVLWVASDLSVSCADNELDDYLSILLIPGSDVDNVRRDWSLTCEVSHGLLTLGMPTLTINGEAVTSTTTAITDGYRIEYSPEYSSSSGARVTAVITVMDDDGNTHTVSWSWTCIVATSTVTDKPIPSLVCLTDIGLATYQADEVYGTVPVIWMDDLVSALHVDLDQCQAVGKGLVERSVNHERILTITTPDIDANGDSLATLQKNDLISVYCPALELYDALAEVKAVQARSVAKSNETISILSVSVYERVQP